VERVLKSRGTAKPPVSKSANGGRRSRRAFLRTAATGAVGLSILRATSAPPAARPNVLLILADDLGAADLNCFGSRDLYTPELDRLAREGAMLTQFYVAAPVCTPSRGAIMTGRDPNRNGARGNGGMLNPDEITMAELLKANGYATGLVGKWHLGGTKIFPSQEGFDFFFGHMSGCIENYHHDYYDWDKGVKKLHDLWRDQELVHEDGAHFANLIVREATAFVDRNRDKPFFLCVAFNEPHYPVQPFAHHLERYKDVPEPRRSYAAFVSTLDEQVGKILRKIEEAGLRGRTLVVFLSDNGRSVEKRNNLWLEDADPKRFGGGSSGPYRGHKGTLWEGGVRLPCIVSMPGRIPTGETRDQLAGSMDLFPTIARYTGSPLPDRDLDGKDIVDVLESNAPSPHAILRRQYGAQWFVREGKWKLLANGPKTIAGVETLPAAKMFLSDMSKDVSETVNLADQYPETVERLTRLHERWVSEKGIVPKAPKAARKARKK